VLGLEDEAIFDCSDVLTGRCSATAALTEVDESGKFSFIPAPINHTDGTLPDSAYTELFNELREDFDFIIVDSCAEMTDYYTSFASHADEAIIVTLHQSTAVRAAEKTAARLSAMGIEKLSLVVNGYRANFAEKGRLPDILEIINRSSIKLLGVVPYSEKLQASQEAAELSFSGELRRKATPWENAFYNIASRLCGSRVKLFEGADQLKKRGAYKGIESRKPIAPTEEII